MTAPARRRKVSGGYPLRVLARGCPLGAAQWEHLPRPAWRTLILPGRRRRPGGGRGQPCALARSGLAAGGSRRPPPGGGPEEVGARALCAHCSLALPLAVYVFSWEPSVWSGACIAVGGGGGGLGARRRHEHRKEAGASEAGPAAGAASPPSCGARSETFVRCPLDQFFFFFASSGASLPPLIRARNARRRWGGGWRREVGGAQCAPPTRSLRLSPPRPPPRSRSLRKLRPSWLLRSGEVLPVAGPLPGTRRVF